MKPPIAWLARSGRRDKSRRKNLKTGDGRRARLLKCAAHDQGVAQPMKSEFLFTSESVSEGHPDKVADQISDSVLDAILEQDPTGRIAAETLVSTGLVVMAGEITTIASVKIARVARDAIRRIGYNDPELRFDAD